MLNDCGLVYFSQNINIRTDRQIYITSGWVSFKIEVAILMSSTVSDFRANTTSMSSLCILVLITDKTKYLDVNV